MRGVGENLALTREELVAIRQAIVIAMDAALVGRRVMPVDDIKNPGAEFYVYDKATDPQAAQIIERGDSIPRDEAKLARTKATFLKLATGFEMTKEDFEASTGGRIRTLNAARAGRKIAELENDLIFNSAAYPDVDGIIDDAGNTAAGTAAWSGGAGVAYPIKDVAAAAAAELADGYPGPYTLICEAVNYGELGFNQASIDRLELERIKALPYIKDLLVDKHVPHGTAILMQPGAEEAVLGMAQDVELEGPFYDHTRQVFQFNLTERVVPAIMRPNAIDTITGL
jgi:uncharacterized linocin/CFP29 family protein